MNAIQQYEAAVLADQQPTTDQLKAFLGLDSSTKRVLLDRLFEKVGKAQVLRLNTGAALAANRHAQV